MLCFVAGPMEAERIDNQKLFRQMKRKKHVAKKARIESPRASAELQSPQTSASGPEVIVAPVVDLEEGAVPKGPKVMVEPTVKPTEPAAKPTRPVGGSVAEANAVDAAEAHPAEAVTEASESSTRYVEMTASSSVGQGSQTILNPQCSLKKSKLAAYPGEVSNWATHSWSAWRPSCYSYYGGEHHHSRLDPSIRSAPEAGSRG
ncbi:PREDICTED: uncharacterized protein LOC104604889 [Nelumbo nucifera]|uniref:Uncharacterized protein LOC104604889 n=1 Tax=Nelumbo nucifera TaxID=4432 RepID=A0A1U8AXI0_NELNU|nr:PREDICTED: uncharacterized protein LOC104604889 [Nelumbo nucifera]